MKRLIQILVLILLKPIILRQSQSREDESITCDYSKCPKELESAWKAVVKNKQQTHAW